MGLKNYHLAAPSTIIADDDRDPNVSWRHHVERSGRGGVDIVAAVGTPVYARTSGVMRWRPNNGSAGNSCFFAHDSNPGWGDVFSHLSRYVGSNGQHFNAGEIVAYTGYTGGVAPHLHWHLEDPQGIRRLPWGYFTTADTPAAEWSDFVPDGTGLTKRIQAALKNRGRYSGPLDDKAGVNWWKGVQTSIKGVGYTGAVDGIPGPSTTYYVQVYAQKFGDYKGPLDRKPGMATWTGFALGLERP